MYVQGLLLLLAPAVHSMCVAKLPLTKELKLLRKWCNARGDEPARCAGVGTPDWASQAALNASALQLDFARLLSSQPGGLKEYCGMSVNHAFALYSTLRAVQPPVVVESGVLGGRGTWLIRHAVPTTRIFCLDPALQRNAWRDPSPLTTYFTDASFSDFGAIDWRALVPKRADRAAGLVVLDDHMSSVRRVAEAIREGFGHMFYEDNWKYFNHGVRDTETIGSDCYSFNTICSHPLPLPVGANGVAAMANSTVMYRDYFGTTTLLIPHREHEANLNFLLGHATAYVELPALFDACAHLGTHKVASAPTASRGPASLYSSGAQERVLRSRASLLSRSGALSLFGRIDLVSWSSYYPPYVRLAGNLSRTLLRETTPWRLGWRAHASRSVPLFSS